MILIRDEAPLFPYVAVMHCPSCGGSRTTMEAVPSELLRGGVPIDVLVKWRCADCRHVFSPPNHLPERGEYVLMCGRCARPEPHVFREARSRAWRDVVPTSHVTTAWVEIYACEACGQEREYGAGRPPLSPTATIPEPPGELARLGRRSPARARS